MILEKNMVPTNEYFQDLSNLFRLGKCGKCIMKLEELANDEGFKASPDLLLRLHKNNKLICEYLESSSGDGSQCVLVIRGFYDLLKESIFSNFASEAELVIVNNVLQFCCCSEVSNESSVSSFECLCAVIIRLKKVLCSFSGQEFMPPITLDIGDPCAEISVLFEDIIKSVQNSEKISKPIIYSSLVLLLQTLFIMNGVDFYKMLQSQNNRWMTKALETISSKVPSFIDFLENDESEAGFKSENLRNIVKSEHHAMEVDIDMNTFGPESNMMKKDLTSIPLFTTSVVGECIVLQDYWKPGAARGEVKQYLLFTLCVIYQLFSDSSTNKVALNFGDKEFSYAHASEAWKYFKGYWNLKNGNFKDAWNDVEGADFSKFPTHFKSKKALLTGSILLKMEKPMMALNFLNKDALDCEDCLPHALLLISEAYECLEYDESLLGVLRQLVKVLRHRKHMENLHHQRYSMFLKTLDLIHPLPKVNLEIALERIAYVLCRNKLYEESVEYFLDLLALLEINGPAKVFRYHLHNCVAVLLMLSETSELDRTKEAISLCNKAVTISQAISNNPGPSNCPLLLKRISEEDGPSANKRPKLELDVQNAFLEVSAAIPVEDQTNVTANLENSDSLGVKDFSSEDISDEVNPDSVYASLVFSEHDLISCILLSECALRESDFSRSLMLLNRSLQHISHHQVLERVKETRRSDFLKATDFILSTLWLRKAKVLIKKELESGINFSRDVEHCFRNALLRNPDNADTKYHYASYLMRSGMNEGMAVKEIVSLVEGKMQFSYLSNNPSLNLAIWYIFRSQTTEEDMEILTGKVKQLK